MVFSLVYPNGRPCWHTVVKSHLDSTVSILASILSCPIWSHIYRKWHWLTIKTILLGARGPLDSVYVCRLLRHLLVSSNFVYVIGTLEHCLWCMWNYIYDAEVVCCRLGLCGCELLHSAGLKCANEYSARTYEYSATFQLHRYIIRRWWYADVW